MTALALVCFAATYLAMALGRLPGLRIDRAGAAFVAAAVLLAASAAHDGQRALETFARALDAPTLLMLFGLMVVSAQFGAAGFYDRCAAAVVGARRSPVVLLALAMAVAATLSALLANDIVVFAMTPVLCRGLLARGLDPRPFLIGLACAANTGSAATIIGNPQNILIGQAGRLDFWAFLAACGPAAVAATALAFAIVAWQWRATLGAAPAAPSAAAPVPKAETPFDPWQVAKATTATAGMLALFATPLPRELAALLVAAGLLLSRRIESRRLLGAVDWNLLLLFACLFVVTAAFAGTGHAAEALRWIAERGFLPDRLAVLAPLSLVASNTISNVPTVVLLLAIWPDPSPEALYGLALLSTLAGNFVLVGSLANIIVAERAAAVGVRLGFRDHAHSGIPVTLVTMGAACLWLRWGGWLAW